MWHFSNSAKKWPLKNQTQWAESIFYLMVQIAIYQVIPPYLQKKGHFQTSSKGTCEDQGKLNRVEVEGGQDRKVLVTLDGLVFP